MIDALHEAPGRLYLREEQPEDLRCFLAELRHPPPLRRLHHLDQVGLAERGRAAVLQQLHRKNTDVQQRSQQLACGVWETSYECDESETDRVQAAALS